MQKSVKRTFRRQLKRVNFDGEPLGRVGNFDFSVTAENGQDPVLQLSFDMLQTSAEEISALSRFSNVENIELVFRNEGVPNWLIYTPNKVRLRLESDFSGNKAETIRVNVYKELWNLEDFSKTRNFV